MIIVRRVGNVVVTLVSLLGEVIQMLENILREPIKFKEIDQILITLIPKVNFPEKVSQFRSVYLCNVIYKCLSKIIVRRLENVLVTLVSPYQVSFVL